MGTASLLLKTFFYLWKMVVDCKADYIVSILVSLWNFRPTLIYIYIYIYEWERERERERERGYVWTFISWKCHMFRPYQLIILLINSKQALQHQWRKCVAAKGTMCQNKPNLVTFHEIIFVGLWTFQLALALHIRFSFHIGFHILYTFACD